MNSRVNFRVWGFYEKKNKKNCKLCENGDESIFCSIEQSA